MPGHAHLGRPPLQLKRMKNGSQPAALWFPPAAAKGSFLLLSPPRQPGACVSDLTTTWDPASAPAAAPQGCWCCPVLQRSVHPTPHLPNIRKDDHMQDPLKGAIIHALDPSDFVCLILQDIIPAAASWHGARLTLYLGWTWAIPSQARPQQAPS